MNTPDSPVCSLTLIEEPARFAGSRSLHPKRFPVLLIMTALVNQAPIFFF